MSVLAYLSPRVMLSAVLRAVRRRSPHWPVVERAHLRDEPACQWCGGRTRLQVHHVLPYHLHPELELNRLNLITLCMGPGRCHFVRGHFSNWFDYNPKVRQECEAHRRSHGQEEGERV